MLALFLALAFLCGLMFLMTAVIKDRDRPEGVEGPGTEGRGQETEGRRRQAAVIAVALARAELDLSLVRPPAVGARGTSWQQYHRYRLLNLNTRKRTTE
jgi:hypothetical protein